MTISISFSLYMCLFFLFILKSKLCTLYFPSTLTGFNNFDFVVVKHVHLLFDNTSLLQDESKTKSIVTKYIKNGTSCVKIVFFCLIFLIKIDLSFDPLRNNPISSKGRWTSLFFVGLEILTQFSQKCFNVQVRACMLVLSELSECFYCMQWPLNIIVIGIGWTCFGY